MPPTAQKMLTQILIFWIFVLLSHVIFNKSHHSQLSSPPINVYKYGTVCQSAPFFLLFNTKKSFEFIPGHVLLLLTGSCIISPSVLFSTDLPRPDKRGYSTELGIFTCLTFCDNDLESHDYSLMIILFSYFTNTINSLYFFPLLLFMCKLFLSINDHSCDDRSNRY